MNTYKEQLQELQEYAFNVLREYPLDKTAANVIAALGNANNQDRIEFFKLNKDEDVVKVFTAWQKVERLKNGLKHTISYIMSTDKGIANGRTTKRPLKSGIRIIVSIGITYQKDHQHVALLGTTLLWMT